MCLIDEDGEAPAAVFIPDRVQYMGKGLHRADDDLLAVRVRRIARTVVPALIEGQKPGIRGPPLGTLECGAHGHRLIVHRKVHHAAAERKERLAGVTIAPVLLDGVVHRLLGQAVLQFKGDDRQTIDELAQVQRPPGLIQTVMQLPGDAEAVRLIQGDGLVVPRRGRPIEEIEAQGSVPDPVAQHVDGPAAVDLAPQPGQEFLPRHALSVPVIAEAEFRVAVRLGGHQEGEQVLQIQRILAVIGGRVTREPAAAAACGCRLRHCRHGSRRPAVSARQIPHDQVFEPFFGGVGGHGSSTRLRSTFRANAAPKGPDII